MNLKDLIGNLTKMLNRIIGEDIHLECQSDGQSFVRADAGMMEQVILNLVVNSRDAMPQGGRLVIATKIITIDERALPPHPSARAGEFVCLSVSDSGTGIAPENLRHIFEPFFTTKEVGKGTGLGLATVYGIIKQHHRWVDVSSRVGEGTTFQIFLPAIQSSIAMRSHHYLLTRCRAEALKESSCVEDDDAGALDDLADAGKNLVIRSWKWLPGRKALEMWQSGKLEVDLLLTDIVMPDGLILAGGWRSCSANRRRG